VAIIDRNNLQNDGKADDIMPMEPIDRKFEAFNWRVLTVDGHDMVAVVQALETAAKPSGKPTCIIARTIKGKGRQLHGRPAGMARQATIGCGIHQACAVIQEHEEGGCL
jgi:transketolase